MEEMFAADEILVTSSSKLCLCADELDGKPVGGKATELVNKLRQALLKEYMDATE